jgi:hypothetical protein
MMVDICVTQVILEAAFEVDGCIHDENTKAFISVANNHGFVLLQSTEGVYFGDGKVDWGAFDVMLVGNSSISCVHLLLEVLNSGGIPAAQKGDDCKANM